ncbi:MAG: sigma-54-dependent Fis family transcriptional regulator [Nitrospirae bacterium]|nr:sigma-54-dependent Fis family transcriptional regulator [Nitrospirota bacterium]MBF0592108.1 sigma-54-dependent Fis family transcriptional regulator [Nitrospirota bacterium]
MKVIVAEDEEISRKHLLFALEDEGYEVKGVGDGLSALKEVSTNDYDVLITDIKMPGMDGMELFKAVMAGYPETSVIIITGFGTIAAAVEAIKQGAEDYITKPFNIDDLLAKLKKISEKKSLQRENAALRASLGLGRDLPFIARSRRMQAVIESIYKLRDADCNVLITGATGTGKGLTARLIHRCGSRKDKPFISINCAVLTEELLASELFGHEKGAFTGAVSTKQGLVELSHTGSLFLDEIAEMTPSLQARLLKVIEEGEFFRVGGTRLIKVNVRFIAATNQNVKALISKGAFREDLYYRLNVMELAIPPLRERKEDIRPLCEFFLGKYVSKYKKGIKGFSKEALQTLMEYDFPGNVRELENIVERAVIIENTRSITIGSLPQGLLMFQIETIDPNRVQTIDELTRGYTEKVIDMFGGNKTMAAQALGISRTSLWRILK